MNPHYKYDVMSRKRNDNIIATAAYQHRTEMRDDMELDPEKRIKSSNTNSEDIINEKTLIPAINPPEIKNASVEYLLNKLNRKGGTRLAARGQLAHQPELTFEQNIEAIELFAKRLALDYNCLFIYATHKKQDGNQNVHTHFMASLYPLVDGEFTEKTKRIYIDEKGKILEKKDTPILKRGKLQYNADGKTYKTKKGWQEVDLDENGKIQYDERGHVKLKDIRIPLVDENGNRVRFKNGNRKNKKVDWVHIKVKKTEMEKRGTAKRTRYLWQDCLNEICKKYKIIDKQTGKLLQFDFRSNAEKDKDKPITQQRLKRWHTGPYKNKRAIAHNQWCDIIEENEVIPDIQNCPFEQLKRIYAIRQEALLLEKRLAQLQAQKTISYKAQKAVSGLLQKIGLGHNKTKQTKTAVQDYAAAKKQQDIIHYLNNPAALDLHLNAKTKAADDVINYSAVTGDYTKSNYYIVSEASKAAKYALTIAMIQKLQKQKNLEVAIEEIDKLKSKQYESLAQRLGLKKELQLYKTWLQNTKNYYAKLPESEKKKQAQPVTTTPITPARTAEQARPEKGTSILPEDPNIKVAWKDKDNKKENEMDKAEKNLYEGWQNFVPDLPTKKPKEQKK